MEKAKKITNGNVNLENIEVKPSLNNRNYSIAKAFNDWSDIDYIKEGMDEFEHRQTKKVLTFDEVWKEYDKFNKE
jgi:hypothetical protein